MKEIKKFIKRTIKFGIDNYILSIFVLIVVLVGVIMLLKLVSREKETLYVKVKISQGLWWATAAKPSYWMVKSLKEGIVEKSLAGNPIAELLEIRAYPTGNRESEQYDTYVTVKLLVDYQSNSGKYIFKRAAVTVGSPIDFEFPEIQVSGTVYEISTKPFQDIYETKTVTFRKDLAKEWEFDSIQQGDVYIDGEDVVLEVLNKNYEETYANYSSIGNNYPVETERVFNIFITVKMKLQKKGSMLFYKEELPIQKGRPINFQTSSFYFDQYKITSIQ